MAELLQHDSGDLKTLAGVDPADLSLVLNTNPWDGVLSSQISAGGVGALGASRFVHLSANSGTEDTVVSFTGTPINPVFIRPSSGHIITLEHGTGIKCPGDADIVLDGDHDIAVLFYYGSSVYGAYSLGREQLSEFAGNLKVNGQAYSALNTLTDAATVATDCDLGNVHKVTLGGNRTLGNPTNVIAGATYSWILIQDGTGGRTLSYGSNFLFADGTAPDLSTDAGAIDVITAIALSSTQLLTGSLLNFS